jgi:HemK-related putative methylase
MIYSPAEDSFLLKKYVGKFCKGLSVLDMGSGSGIISETALNNKAKSVLAADINPESISLLKSKNILCVKSDLFNKLKGKKFDIIAFNPPYLPEDEREPDDSKPATTGGKKGDETILRFLKQSKKHLNKNGFILLILSSLNPEEKVLETLKRLHLNHRVLESKKFFMESLYILKIEKA